MKPQDRTRRILKSALEPSQKLLLVAIADHMEDTPEGEDRNSRPSVALLCEETGLGERAVQGHLRALEVAGVLIRHQIPGHRTPHYQVKWSLLEREAPPQNLRPAESAPRRICAPTPAESAGVPPQNLLPRQTTQATIKATISLPPPPPSPAPPATPVIVTSQAERELEAPKESGPDSLTMTRIFGDQIAEALEKAGVRQVSDLTRLTEREVRHLPGIGEGRVAQIRLRLDAMGQRFAGRVAATEGPPREVRPIKKRSFDEEPLDVRQANG